MMRLRSGAYRLTGNRREPVVNDATLDRLGAVYSALEWLAPLRLSALRVTSTFWDVIRCVRARLRTAKLTSSFNGDRPLRPKSASSGRHWLASRSGAVDVRSLHQSIQHSV
jgi:hypothetical protein